jgi:phosphoglycerate dehydrogenase-like enzyme
VQILMSEAAHARVADRLRALDASLEVIILHGDGALSKAGSPIAEEEMTPEAVWISLDLYPSELLGRLFGLIVRSPTVRWAQSFAAGVDHPVFKAIVAKGVALSKSSAQAPAMAEYVLCNAFSLLHPIARYEDDKAERRWRQVGYREIASTHWALIGFGAIGREIALRLKPFNARLTVLRRTLGPEPLADEVLAWTELLKVVPDADVVVLACALNEETKGLAGEAFFQALKPGSLLINVGRGGLLDEAALQRGLDRDQPAHAVLDVFETEPLPDDSWIWSHPKVRISPHFSGGGDGVLGRGDSLFLENLARYLRKSPLLNETHRSEVGL